jgi:hypothetical protein
MLELSSVDQILRVLELLRQNRRLGFDIAAACSRAIQQVAKEANVRYQTIGDGCRRRLGLVDMSAFHRLVDEWLRGNPAQLIKVLKQNSTPAAASRISQFFQESQATFPSARVASTAPSPVKNSHPVRITIEDGDARMLRVLAQLEGREPDAVAADLLRESVRDRLRAALA